MYRKVVLASSWSTCSMLATPVVWWLTSCQSKCSTSVRMRMSSGTAIDGCVSFNWIATCAQITPTGRRKMRDCNYRHQTAGVENAGPSSYGKPKHLYLLRLLRFPVSHFQRPHTNYVSQSAVDETAQSHVLYSETFSCAYHTIDVYGNIYSPQ